MMPRTPRSSTPTSPADLVRAALLSLLLATPAMLPAQAPTLRDVLPGWIGLIAAPGREGHATEQVVRASAGWTRGPLGSLVRRAGAGAPRRVIACSLDRPAYSVSEITADGFARVHNAEPTSRHALWDQFHEGQRVLVQRRDGGVAAGVFAVRSTHLWRRRAQQEALATADDLWLDVGASSRAEVEALGIRMLDPVVRELPAWTYGDAADPFVAGAGAVQRTGCAALAAIAGAAPASGENVYVIATHASFAHSGLAAVLAQVGRVDEVILAGEGVAPDSAGVAAGPLVPPLPDGPGARARVTGVTMRARFAGTLMESVRAGDVDAFALALARAAGVRDVVLRPVALGGPDAVPPAARRRDAMSPVADLLGHLSDVYGLSGHEHAVRDAIRAALPAWARARAAVDSAGNLVLAVGPDRDTTVVIAHMDEIGFDVTRIARDGTLSLRPRGSFYASLYEGQPAFLHVGDGPAGGRAGGRCAAAGGGPMRGVFVPRDSAARRQPAALTAWLGMDSTALAARGVRVGSPLTGYKCATRLAGLRFTARSLDDRAGVTALLLALGAIDERRLTHKTIFVWSVREEVGLDGAAALAARLGPSVRRVHAVDTFVSADSPLEGTRFGYAPIGSGAVIRALDNSSVAPPAEIARVVALARARRIPLTVGATNGGNDGSELVRYGAVNIPVAWPLRYSHSPAELIDLRDVRALADVVRAIVEAR
jgi:putative aminopeptidase FrvX